MATHVIDYQKISFPILRRARSGPSTQRVGMVSPIYVNNALYNTSKRQYVIPVSSPLQDQHTESVVDLEHGQKRPVVNQKRFEEMIMANPVTSDVADLFLALEAKLECLESRVDSWTASGEPLVFKDIGSPSKPHGIVRHEDGSMGQPNKGPLSCPPGSPPKPHESSGRALFSGLAGHATTPLLIDHQDSSMGQPNKGPLSCPPGSPPKPHESSGRALFLAGCAGHATTPLLIDHQDSSMGQLSVGPVSPSHVIGRQFTSKDPVTLIFRPLTSGGYIVFPTTESTVPWKLKISPCDTTLHRKLKLEVLGGDVGRRVVTLEAQILTTDGLWVGYSGSGRSQAGRKNEFSILRGNGTDDVHATLKKGSIDDFNVTGSLEDGNCTIYKSDSSTIAQMLPMEDGNMDTFMVKVSPNVDCALVVSLIAVADVIKSPGKVKHHLRKAGNMFFKCVGVCVGVVSLALNVSG